VHAQHKWRAGLELYTRAHWDVLTPARLGFRGRDVQSSDPGVRDAEADMAAFFAPLNAKLDKLMADHKWPWTPFTNSTSAA
jgi:hypothetical protein